MPIKRMDKLRSSYGLSHQCGNLYFLIIVTAVWSWRIFLESCLSQSSNRALYKTGILQLPQVVINAQRALILQKCQGQYSFSNSLFFLEFSQTAHVSNLKSHCKCPIANSQTEATLHTTLGLPSSSLTWNGVKQTKALPKLQICEESK